MKKRFLSLLILIFLLFGVSACTNVKEENKSYGTDEEAIDLSNGTIDNVSYKETEEITNYVKIEMTNNKVIIVELYPDIAPISVKNFQKLVSANFYDGLIFHRVIKDFMIQSGDPNGTGTGGSDESITGEFEANGIKNSISHVRGVISMARRGANPDTEETMNSATSQFFIVHQDSPHLDGNYAAFGKVIVGIDIVDNIAQVKTNAKDKPLTNQTIRTIRFVDIED